MDNTKELAQLTKRLTDMEKLLDAAFRHIAVLERENKRITGRVRQLTDKVALQESRLNRTEQRINVRR